MHATHHRVEEDTHGRNLCAFVVIGPACVIEMKLARFLARTFNAL